VIGHALEDEKQGRVQPLIAGRRRHRRRYSKTRN
jgi:hypothetical protein